MINVFQPSLNGHEIEAFARTVDSNWIGKGKQVDEFERLWAEHIGVDPRNVVAITSATEGLFQSVRLLGIRPGDEVIMPAISFVGAANAVVAAGAKPVFCDVNPRTLNPTGKDIASCMSNKTMAVMVLHYGGLPADVDSIIDALCEHEGKWPKLIEDCACAPYSRVDDVPVGTNGAIGIWSFDAMKIMSTGDGGMVFCNSRKHADALRLRIGLGTSSESGMSSGKDNRWWEFSVTDPTARKATMNDLTASIGISQLARLPDFVDRRWQIHNLYNGSLGDLDWLALPPVPSATVISSFYAYWIQTDHRDALSVYLREHGVYTTFRYFPLNQVPAYGVQPLCPNAIQAAATTLWLPCHQGLSDKDVAEVCQLIHDFGKTL